MALLMKDYGPLTLEGLPKRRYLWKDLDRCSESDPWQDAVFGDLLRAVAFVHGKGFCHRDLKRCNVLVTLFVAPRRKRGGPQEQEEMKIFRQEEGSLAPA